MKKIELASNSSIAKPNKEVKGFQAMSEWQKELTEKYLSRGFKGKNIPDYGEYRVYFTRATLEKELKNLNHKERFLRLVFELYRDKKSNIAYPPFRDLIKYSNMPRRTLIRTIQSLEKKQIFQIERRKGNNNIYRFL